MKQKEISLNIPPEETNIRQDINDDHISPNYETPLRPDAFQLDDETKVKKIEALFSEIMDVLGLDLTDDSLKGTPLRVAKMYVEEVFSGLNPDNKPEARLFDNKFKYNEMIVEKDITFYSYCEHHFVPIFGKAHVAYISSGKVIGLSKINRIVQYFAKRPQVQERMTMQIAHEIKEVLKTRHVGVVMDATHLCVASRGVSDTNSRTGTAHFSGKFEEGHYKSEFLNYINSK